MLLLMLKLIPAFWNIGLIFENYIIQINVHKNEIFCKENWYNKINKIQWTTLGYFKAPWTCKHYKKKERKKERSLSTIRHLKHCCWYCYCSFCVVGFMLLWEMDGLGAVELMVLSKYRPVNSTAMVGFQTFFGGINKHVWSWPCFSGFEKSSIIYT